MIYYETKNASLIRKKNCNKLCSNFIQPLPVNVTGHFCFAHDFYSQCTSAFRKFSHNALQCSQKFQLSQERVKETHEKETRMRILSNKFKVNNNMSYFEAENLDYSISLWVIFTNRNRISLIGVQIHFKQKLK